MIAAVMLCTLAMPSAVRAQASFDRRSDTVWTTCGSQYQRVVDASVERMRLVAEDRAGAKPAPGKWSRKEILGHLIDSAVNNQIRFVRAQLYDDMIFTGYDQNAWVSAQRYQERSWSELVHTWRAYNHQVAAVMRAAAVAELERPRPRHNLHDIGFQLLPPDTPATLGWLMRDYVVHLQHHLDQILRIADGNATR